MIDANTSALDAQLNKEESQDKRAEAVEALASSMMLEGGEFYPFAHENIVEALCNSDNGSMLAITAQIYSAEKNPNNHVAQECTTFSIRQLCRDYWGKCALKQADAKYVENEVC